MADADRRAAIERSNTLTLGCLVYQTTATSQEPHEVNKFLIAYVILFKRADFRQYFVCLRDRIFNCCNVLSQVEVKVRDRIAAIISEIIGCSGRQFSIPFRV